ncbi:MAG: heavy metal translocating P-type ATPase [Robiginitomaculum sp.]|nr:MAG: heavy metal translocating P-type ATPase [Robiginitomaculum sp.]
MMTDSLNHAHNHRASTGACASNDAAMCGDISPVGNTSAKGRSFRVNGLDCAEEVSTLQKVLGPLLGGEEYLAFDVLNARMTVLDTGKALSDEDIINAVGKTGMSASQWDAQSAEADHAANLERQKRFTLISGFFWGAGLAYHIANTGLAGALHIFEGHGNAAMPLAEILLFALAIVFGARFVAPKAWSSARRLSPDMNLLMVIAVGGAILINQYFEAATVAFFFSLSLMLESWSVGRARNAVATLLDLAPPTARVIREDGSEAEIMAAEVAIGDRFIVRGGDRIALDGEVVIGAGAVNQAPITGESVPVSKEVGDEVYAGTVNGEGTLIVRASKIAGDTVLARIIRMVGDAHSRRAPVEQWVAKFARIYTPSVMVLAILVAIVPPLLLGASWGFWFYNALVLLVIACPCALVISTPVSIVAALASSARQGVLIKGGAYIEIPSRLDVLALDKTGTITKGEPEMVGIYPLNGTDENTLLASAAALEARSSHPLAMAILAQADAKALAYQPADEVTIVPGRGVTGRLGKTELWLGSPRYANERGVGAQISADLLAGIEERGETVVVIGDGDKALGLIALADAIRPDAKRLVADLHALGVKKLVMLTGDNKRAANSVARAVGIDEIHAELLPEDKVAVIEELITQYPVVAMIGDGVNDAPAMARASFAIAMGAVGSDAAIETADIALMTDDIGKLPWLVKHSRRTMAIIRQNIGLSLAVKAVFVILTAFGLASMWGAIAADVGVSLIVVANALRMLGQTKVI